MSEPNPFITTKLLLVDNRESSEVQLEYLRIKLSSLKKDQAPTKTSWILVALVRPRCCQG